MRIYKTKVTGRFRKEIGAVILFIGIIFAGILLMSCQLQNSFGGDSDANYLKVIVDYERHEDLPGIYKIDVIIPRIESEKDAIEKLNESIRVDFSEFYDLNAANISEILGGWRYPQINITYKVVRIKKISAISIITEIYSEEDQGRESSVQSYFYDETQNKILSSKEYLRKIGLTPDDVEEAFLKGAGKDYNLENVEFSSLENHFYINEQNEPIFFVAD